MELLMIADDFTGALDTGVKMAEYGMHTKVTTDVSADLSGRDGTEILVGKNNTQNDRLTFRIAARDDLWLHTKDIPGSHVILRTGGVEPDEQTLLLAASLAAHFSQASGSSNIPVDYTPCRFVKKPSGAKPGFVIFTHQKTIAVTPDEKRLEKILAQENPHAR